MYPRPRISKMASAADNNRDSMRDCLLLPTQVSNLLGMHNPNIRVKVLFCMEEPWENHYVNHVLKVKQTTCSFLLPSASAVGHVSVFVILSGFVRPTKCTTSTVQIYVVCHRPALCTTNLCCAPWCIRGTYFFRSRGHPPTFTMWCCESSC